MEGNFNLADTARNPAGSVSIRTQNKSFATQGLSDEEAQLFEEQFNILVNDFASREITQLYKAREDQIAEAAALAKNQFDEKLFGGINAADNEIGFDVIRPGHVRSDPSDGSTVNDWSYEVYESGGTASTSGVAVEGAGWNDWIGDGANNNYSVSEDQILIVLGMVDMADNNGIRGVNVNKFGRNVDMLPKDLNDSRTGDTENDITAQALPTLIGNDRDELHIRLDADTGVHEPRLIGFTFGVGSYMNQEEY